MKVDIFELRREWVTTIERTVGDEYDSCMCKV